MSEQQSSGGGGCGCISLIATGLVLWAFFFGWTYQGKHYDIGCSCDRGVVVE